MWITQNPPQTIKLDDAIDPCIIKYEYVETKREKNDISWMDSWQWTAMPMPGKGENKFLLLNEIDCGH